MVMMDYYWQHGEDRVSTLPDRALVRVLSHLPSVEAARASALSRGWRRVFSTVPVVDLVDGKIANRRRTTKPACFDQKVTSAILGKGPGTPIRALRLLALDVPSNLLDQWVLIAATSSVEEVDVALRYSAYASRQKLCPFVASEDASAAYFDHYDAARYAKTPRQLFRCTTLRRLRLTNWTLDVPRGVGVGGFTASSLRLDTICLKRIVASNEAIQQLLSACPRLADLSLEECPGATDFFVPSDHLRSFAMVCCHNAWRVALHTRRIRSLRYKGGLPWHTWFFYVANYDEVTSLTIDICEDLTAKSPPEVAHLTSFISRCRKLTYLHLALRPSMAYYCSQFTAVLSNLPELRQLVLKGFLATNHAVRSVAVLLVNAINLEELSLFPQGRGPSKETYDSDDDFAYVEPENCLVADEAIDYDWMTNNLWRMYIPCLNYSLRRISISNYGGNAFDRMLAQFLVWNAAVLEEFSVTLLYQLWPHKEEIAMEFRSWLYNPGAIVTCN